MPQPNWSMCFFIINLLLNNLEVCKDDFFLKYGMKIKKNKIQEEFKVKL